MSESAASEQPVAEWLTTSEALVEASLVSLGVGLWTHDLLTGQVRWSPTLYSLAGQTPTQPPSLSAWLALIHPADRPAIEPLLLARSADAQPQTITYRLQRTDGTIRHLHMVIATAVDARGRPRRWQGLVLDVTDGTIAQTQLAAAEAAAEQVRAVNEQLVLAHLHLQAEIERATHLQMVAEEAVRARDEFLSIAAHELRTPVTGISGFAQRLSHDLAAGRLDSARLARALAMINRASHRLMVLTEELLDISRLRLGQLPLSPEPLDLVQLVGLLVERYHEQRGQLHQLVFTPPPTPIMLVADAGRLEQVVINVLENAIKYSPAGGTVTVTLEPQAAGWCLRVRDEGIGIPSEALETIFQPFGRAPNATAHHLPSMGLGLAICRGITERHGGRIWAESDGEGQGTTVSVWLPESSAVRD